MQGYGKLTCSSLLHLFRRNPQDVQHFNHYLYDNVRHRRIRSNLGIGLQASEKVLDAFKDVNESLLCRNNILSRLGNFRVKPSCKETSRAIQTWRSTPAPANITFAGEKTCVIAVKS